MKTVILFLLILAGISTNAQDIDSLWIRNNYSKKEVYITMRDGVRLFTSGLHSKQYRRGTSNFNEENSILLPSLRQR